MYDILVYILQQQSRTFATHISCPFLYSMHCHSVDTWFSPSSATIFLKDRCDIRKFSVHSPPLKRLLITRIQSLFAVCVCIHCSFTSKCIATKRMARTLLCKCWKRITTRVHKGSNMTAVLQRRSKKKGGGQIALHYNNLGM